jgi:carbonic anhydrase/acetyltransferase-like protein (isoleucine patch superfamily)
MSVSNDAQIEGDVSIGATSIIENKAYLVCNGDGQKCIIEEGNIIEDFVRIRNSHIGNSNLIEVKVTIDEVDNLNSL